MYKIARCVCALVFLLLSSMLPAKSSDYVKVWDFEDGTAQGWLGSEKWSKALNVNTDAKYISEGGKSLMIDLTGSTGWNQDIMVNSGPFPAELKKMSGMTMDVFVPAASIKGMDYQEIYLVISGKNASWYQLKKSLNTGKNEIDFKLDNSKVSGDIWKVLFIFNSSQPFTGPIYVDNIKIKTLGDPSTVEGRVKEDITGTPVEGAMVVMGGVLVKTGSDGKFSIKAPSDKYNLSVYAGGYKSKSGIEVSASSDSTNILPDIAVTKEKEAGLEAVNVDIDAAKIIRDIDKHKMYGNNLAPWVPVAAYQDKEAMDKLIKSGATLIRIPGGAYGNLYDWKTGSVYRPDGGVQWTPEVTYFGVMVPFLKKIDEATGGKAEALPVINIMTPAEKSIEERVTYQIEWLKDIKSRGIKFNYVEIGNEPDYHPSMPGPDEKDKNVQWYKAKTDLKNTKWWTRISNYCKVYNYTAERIKKEFPEVKFMGPCPGQPMNREDLDGNSWKDNPEKGYWVEEFLKQCWKYADVLVVHEYPFWDNNDFRKLMQTPGKTWPVYMPKYKDWIKKYVNSKKGYEDKKVEVALTEWNSGFENQSTASIDNALFAADYLGNVLKERVDMACIWDMFTQKIGDGGGHGILDPVNDPTNKYSERGHYWALDLYANKFGTKMIEAVSDNPNLSVYASITENNKITIMAINKTSLKIERAAINIKGAVVSGQAKAWRLSEKEYLWCPQLYRPIINNGPVEIKVDKSGNNMTYDFPPRSITLLEL